MATNKIAVEQKQDTSEMATNQLAVEQMRDTFRKNEKILKEELETKYRTEIINLKRINAEQKQANIHNNATSLSKLHMQEKTIQELYKQMDQHKESHYIYNGVSDEHQRKQNLLQMRMFCQFSIFQLRWKSKIFYLTYYCTQMEGVQ